MNQFMAIGNLVRDAEIRRTKDGLGILNFTLAVTKEYQAKGKEKESCFFDFTLFGKRADSLQMYLKKGIKVLVRGELQVNKYIAKDGSTKSSYSTVVEYIEFLSKAKYQEQEAEVENTAEELFETAKTDDDDLPF